MQRGNLTTTGELSVSKPRKCWGSKCWDLKAILSEENLMESSSPQVCPELRSVLRPPQTEHEPLWTLILLGGHVQTNTWCGHWDPWDLPSEGSEPPPPELTGFLRKKLKTFCPLQQQIAHIRVRKKYSNTLGTYCLKTKCLHLCNILVASQMFGRYYGYLQVRNVNSEWQVQRAHPEAQHLLQNISLGKGGSAVSRWILYHNYKLKSTEVLQ